MRANLKMAIAALTGLACVVGGCSGGSNGVSTASVLDGTPKAGATNAAVGVDNPNARTQQVAFTAARAQRCGFVFDPAKLKTNFLTAEAQRLGPNGAGAGTEVLYDKTFSSNLTRIKADPEYCAHATTEAIKADLQRHLAGNYEPNQAVAGKKVASGGLFDGLISDEPPEKFDSKNFWEDLHAKQNGAKGAQKTDE